MMEMQFSTLFQKIFIVICIMTVSFGAGMYIRGHQKILPIAEDCTEATRTIYQNVTEYLPMQCPAIPACPACTCQCSTKATADKSIHFNLPLTQCVNYNPKYPAVRVRGNDLITYRWYDCSKSEWVEGDVDEDGWLQI
jgi:hypothetical protein